MTLAPELWRSSNTQLLTELRRAETQSRQLDAHRYALIGELSNRGIATETGYASPARLLMDLLLISRAEANRRIALAEALTPRRPLTGPDLPPLLAATAHALTEGELGVEHAEIIRRTLTDLPPEVTQTQQDTTETALVDAAREIGPAGLAAMARALRTRLDQDGNPPTDTELQHPHNTLRYVTKPNGRLTFKGELDPEGAGWLTTVISALAAPKPTTTDGPDPRDLPERQGDALIEALRLAATCDQLPTDGGERPTLLITLPLDALRDHLPPTLFNQSTPQRPNQPDADPRRPLTIHADPTCAHDTDTDTDHTHHTDYKDDTDDTGDTVDGQDRDRDGNDDGYGNGYGNGYDDRYGNGYGNGDGDGDRQDRDEDGAAPALRTVGRANSAHPTNPHNIEPTSSPPTTDRPADRPPDTSQPSDDQPKEHLGNGRPPNGPGADRPVGDRPADTSTAPSHATHQPPSGASHFDHPLLGVSTAERAGPDRSNPFAILDGIGLIDARIARRLACDCAIIPVVLGANSEPLDIGRKTRIIPTSIRRALITRDRGCTFPGCIAAPKLCDAHHIVQWANGGPTALPNLALLCGQHHRLLHHSEWVIRIATDGHPEFIPPTYIDPTRHPRRNRAHPQPG